MEVVRRFTSVKSEIYIGPVYASLDKAVGKTVKICNVFSEDLMALKIFMVGFESRFCYSTYFQHCVVFDYQREDLVKAGAISVNEEVEMQCINKWQRSALKEELPSEDLEPKMG